MQQNDQQQQANQQPINQQQDFKNYQVKEGSIPQVQGQGQTQIKNKKFIKYGALALLLGFIGTIFLLPETVDTSAEAVAALQQGYSTQLPVGTRLLGKDQQLQSRDFIIPHTSAADKQSILVWDFAAEDGDYVQLFNEIGAITGVFMIKNTPQAIEVVAAIGVITVKGMIDGGGGITYAIYSPLTETIYYNGTQANAQNTYTFTKQ